MLKIKYDLSMKIAQYKSIKNRCGHEYWPQYVLSSGDLDGN